MESSPWPFDAYGTPAFLIATSLTPRLLGGNRICRRRKCRRISPRLSTGSHSYRVADSCLADPVSGSAPIRLYSIPVAISVSETFVFTSIILFGPSAGTLTVALDAAIISFWSIQTGSEALQNRLQHLCSTAHNLACRSCPLAVADF